MLRFAGLAVLWVAMVRIPAQNNGQTIRAAAVPNVLLSQSRSAASHGEKVMKRRPILVFAAMPVVLSGVRNGSNPSL